MSRHPSCGRMPPVVKSELGNDAAKLSYGREKAPVLVQSVTFTHEGETIVHEFHKTLHPPTYHFCCTKQGDKYMDSKFRQIDMTRYSLTAIVALIVLFKASQEDDCPGLWKLSDLLYSIIRLYNSEDELRAPIEVGLTRLQIITNTPIAREEEGLAWAHQYSSWVLFILHGI
jgi:hypothetical protein